MTNFTSALAMVLKHEGGYSNIPEDHGGPTNWGITQHDLAVHRGHPVSPDDVKHMSVQEAGAIYLKTYWSPYRLDMIKDAKLAACIFDQGVLCGPHTAIKLAQEACGVTADGVIGPITIAALNSGDAAEIIMKFLAYATARYHGIVEANHSQSIFLRGWLNRIADLRALPDASAA